MTVLPDSPSSSARTWVVHSVVVRARDGPQRLTQVYRLLLAATSATSPTPAADDQPSPRAACAPRRKEPIDVLVSLSPPTNPADPAA